MLQIYGLYGWDLPTRRHKEACNSFKEVHILERDWKRVWRCSLFQHLPCSRCHSCHSNQSSIRAVHVKFMMFTACGWRGQEGVGLSWPGVLDSHLRVNETKPGRKTSDESYFLWLPSMYHHHEHFCLMPVIEWDFEFRSVTMLMLVWLLRLILELWATLPQW